MKVSERVSKIKPDVNKKTNPFRKQMVDSSQHSNSFADRVMILQRTIGNQGVKKMIRSGALQAKPRIRRPKDKYEQEADRVVEHEEIGLRRQPIKEKEDEEKPGYTTEGNPLVGLTREDGITWGTWERRPRVQLLQEKLNAKMMAGLNQDGMYGSKTGQVLNEFQVSIGVPPQVTVDPVTANALMDRKEPGSDDKKKSQPMNAELEDTMDAIWLQYQIMLKNQNDALNRLEKDLSGLEYETNIVPKILIAVGEAVLDKVMFAGDSTVRKLIKDEIMKSTLFDEEKEDLNKNVDTLFEAANAPSKKVLNDVINEMTGMELPAIDIFIESQRNAITMASDKDQETFLLKTKPELRKPSENRSTPIEGGEIEDRRIEKARTMMKSVEKTKTGSFEKQYDNSLQKWAVYQAQTKLGVINEIDSGEVRTSTDMSKGETGVPGVLELEIEGDTPDKPVRVTGARIKGLSPAVRKKLVNQHETISYFPHLAEGDVSSGSVKIAENEDGKEFECGSSDNGKKWLFEKAQYKYGFLPDFGKITVMTGVRAVFEEIDNKDFSTIEDKLQGA